MIDDVTLLSKLESTW